MQRTRQKQEGHSNWDRQTGTESGKGNKSVERNAKARHMSRKEGETQKRSRRCQRQEETGAGIDQGTEHRAGCERQTVGTESCSQMLPLPLAFGDIALHSPGWPGSPDPPASDSQCPKISPFLSTSVNSISILHLGPRTSPCPSFLLLVDSPVYPYPVSPRGTGCQGGRWTDPWQEQLSTLGEHNLYPESDTPAQDREEPANQQTEGENLGCGEARFACLMQQPSVPTPEAPAHACLEGLLFSPCLLTWPSCLLLYSCVCRLPSCLLPPSCSQPVLGSLLVFFFFFLFLICFFLFLFLSVPIRVCMPLKVTL